MKEAFGDIRATFGPLSNRNLRRYVSAQAVSMTGTWMQATAQAWLVWKLSHSPASLGILGTFGMIPFLFLAPWTGVWADRVNRRNLLRITQTASMFLAFTLALLVQTDVIRLWHVYLMAILLGCVSAFDIPTHQAFLGDLSGIADLRKAILINNIVFQSSRLVGPMLAGLLIGVAGISAGFWINGLSYLAVIWALSRVSVRPTVPPRRGKSFQEFVESIRFIRDTPRIQYLFAFSVFVSFLAFSSHQIMAAYVSEVLRSGPATLGVLMGFSGLGAFFGSLIVTPITYRSPRIGFTLAKACTWSGAWLVVLACSRSLPLSLLAMAFASAAMPVVLTTSNGLIQCLSAEGMRGRLVSAWLMVVFGVQPIAALLVGFYASFAGVPAAIALNGILMVAGSVILLAGSPGLRGWRHTGNPPLHLSEQDARADG
jgi:MFS family permease